MDRKLAERLRRDYPCHIPIKVAAQLLGFSECRLAKLVADGREPFASIGANIGINQRYIRIYTERLISYLSATSAQERTGTAYEPNCLYAVRNIRGGPT